ncbi:hypothetical protein [Pedobacter sp. BMA]|uniref:hypothetical protein n=1 Tax=Pedobacter sp. BMA TaxID=1663685 RepID=UPI000AA06A5B|nr:hypothetical protein [Pedobacter sp. BMA]
MKAKLITLLAILVLTSVDSFGGWFKIYNYAGAIDHYPVTLSFQIRDGYFGEAAKKTFNAIGVYKYDKFNNPIRLEGRFNQKTNEIELYELGSNGKVSAIFQLRFSNQQLIGTWNSGKNKRIVKLKLDNKLSDLSDEAFKDIKILQLASLNDYYFVGLYAKKSAGEDANMTALRIINKKTNTIFQTLNFENIDTPTGNIMTIIYDNVPLSNGNNFYVSNQIGRVGGYLNVSYNAVKKRFILDPEPVAEGVKGNE